MLLQTEDFTRLRHLDCASSSPCAAHLGLTDLALTLNLSFGEVESVVIWHFQFSLNALM